MIFPIRAACLLFIGAMTCPFGPAATDRPGDIVVLKPYVVEGSYTKVVLKIAFRHHIIWSGVKSLTFTSVPATWASAGVKVGDRLIRIDGQVVDGLKIRDFGTLLKKTVAEPSAAFDIESSETGLIRQIEVHVKKGEAGEFTITS